MITRRQLREIHGNELPLHILEQDYIQSLFLKELYKRADFLVFKGGTFLKHAYGLDRFSEDLEFTICEEGDVIEQLKDAASTLHSYGVEASIDRIDSDDLSFSGRLRYRGPLFDGSKRSVGTLNIEASKRGDVFLEPTWVRLFFEYPEARVVNVLGLQKEEVLAEKLRALSMREKGRDLYDVWFLLRQDITPQKTLVERKMETVGHPPRISLTITESEWVRDLGVLVVNPPPYHHVKKEVVETLTEHGFDIE